MYGQHRDAQEAKDRTCRIHREERGRAWDGADAFTALKDVDGVKVVGIREHGSQPGAKKLTKPISWDFLPREAAKDGKGKSDGGVTVATRDST